MITEHDHIDWHAISTEMAWELLRSRPEGLASTEAEERLRRYGKNIFPQARPISAIFLLTRQFDNILVYLLIAAAAAALALGRIVDAAFIVLVLAVNVAVGWFQEYKADRSLHMLQRTVHRMVRVRRSNGAMRQIDAASLVPGDVIEIEAGDAVPADCIVIIAEDGFKVNETALTGEWYPIRKYPGIVKDDAPLFERTNSLYMGSMVEEGRAVALVVKTGDRTKLGEIAALLKATPAKKTPLQRKIARLSRFIAGGILATMGVITAIGLYRGMPVREMIMASLALTASAIPEGLLPSITAVLVLGMRRITREKGLIRRLPAAETLGGVTTICADKTGTLTEGVMEVSELYTAKDGLFGADPKIAEAGEGAGKDPRIRMLEMAALVSDAFVEEYGTGLEQSVVRGKSTDRALLTAALRAGITREQVTRGCRIVDGIRFGSDTKYAATLLEMPDGTYMLAVIGAPEQLAGRSTTIDGGKAGLPFDASMRKALSDRIDALAGDGMHMVACAYRQYSHRPLYRHLANQVDELTFTGLIAIRDPLRADARQTISSAKTAGIRVVLMTGDHRNTAIAVARQTGIHVDSERMAVEGPEMDRMTDKELKAITSRISVYARMSPHHKLRVVEALRHAGEIVAMVGDGINDTPAIRIADTGIALGTGAEMAREAADIILLDNDLKTVLKAIEEGRTTFENIRKIVTYLLADNWSLVTLFAGSMLMGLPLPLLPAQVLWINMIEDAFPNVALSMERARRKDVMTQRPRNPRGPLIDRSLGLWMGWIFIVSSAAILGAYVALGWTSMPIGRIRTVVFALAAMDSLFFAYSVRSFTTTIFHKDILSNRALNIAVMISGALLLAAIYTPPLQTMFGTVPLMLQEWMAVLLVALMETVAIEAAKYPLFISNRHAGQAA